MTMTKPRVLCVDDEPGVLEGLEFSLGRRCELHTAAGGAAGLELLEREAAFAVVVSDMRMPGMNGAEFLAQVRQRCPETVRMLLTGHADIDAAIAAVNDGQIFRFLSKPCPPDVLVRAVDAAFEQYRLIVAERELLEHTLMGSLRALGDVLALASPDAFGRATRIKRYATELAADAGVVGAWQVEAAAVLSQIGYITLAPDMIARLNQGRPLTSDEQRALARVPDLNEQLLAHIPRLERVRAMMAAAERPPVHHAAVDEDVRVGGEILRIAFAFDRCEARGLQREEALQAMALPVLGLEPALFAAFTRRRRAELQHDIELALPVSEVRPGMVLAEDVRMTSGVLLAARGYVVTEAFVERIRNAAGTIVEPVRCTCRGMSAAA